MKVSIVIPCFNQRDTITQTILTVRKAPLPETEIILVDDGSNDGTRTVLKCEVESIVDRVIYHGLNQGKGATLRDGFAAASGDIILVQDAVLECRPSEYTRLLEPILSNKADAVFGSRFIGSAPPRFVNFWQTIGAKLVALLSNMCAKTKLTDMGSGYNAFRASIIRNIQLREQRFGVEPEITAKLARAHCRICEVAIGADSHAATEGVAMRWRDVVRGVYAVLKYNFFARGPSPFPVN
jgi:glycosyltransferase involved in cell wall biosynthesis